MADAKTFAPTGEQYTHELRTTNAAAKQLYIYLKSLPADKRPEPYDTREKLMLLQHAFDQVEVAVILFQRAEKDLTDQLVAIEQQMDGHKRPSKKNRFVDDKARKTELEAQYNGLAKIQVVIDLTAPVAKFLEDIMESALTCEPFLEEICSKPGELRHLNMVFAAVDGITEIDWESEERAGKPIPTEKKAEDGNEEVHDDGAQQEKEKGEDDARAAADADGAAAAASGPDGGENL